MNRISIIRIMLLLLCFWVHIVDILVVTKSIGIKLGEKYRRRSYFYTYTMPLEVRELRPAEDLLKISLCKLGSR